MRGRNCQNFRLDNLGIGLIRQDMRRHLYTTCHELHAISPRPLLRAEMLYPQEALLEIDNRLGSFVPFYKKLWRGNNPQYHDELTDEMVQLAFLRASRECGHAVVVRKPDGKLRLEPTAEFLKWVPTTGKTE
jgi:hypothetical protein